MATTPLDYFMARRTAACTDLLEKNEDVAGFMAALLQHLVDYARENGISPQQIRLDLPFVTNDGKIVAQIRHAPQ